MNLAEIDKNFFVEQSFDRTDVKGYNILNAPFSIHGLIFPEDENDGFHRIADKEVANLNKNIARLQTHTAGGRVRFKTDAAFIGLRAVVFNSSRLPHFPYTGSIGFDLYVKEEDGRQTHLHTYAPPVNPNDSYVRQKVVEGGSMREYTINFPLYSSVQRLEIFIEESAHIEAPDPYTYQTPIMYYGSSITQGACASRPGTSYESIISRRFDCDFINLGFAGNAKGEPEMARYIAAHDMSIFVYDYDHNAPTDEHYEATHENMFLIIREAHPDLPVIFVNRPSYYMAPSMVDRRMAITKKTYQNALDRGDKNVYFIDCRDFYPDGVDTGILVDGCHPNDLGFWFMAKRIGDEIGKILGK